MSTPEEVDTNDLTLREYLESRDIIVKSGTAPTMNAALDLLQKQEDELIRLRRQAAEQQIREDEGSANMTELARLIAVYAQSLTALEVAPDLVRSLIRDYADITLRAFYGMSGGRE